MKIVKHLTNIIILIKLVTYIKMKIWNENIRSENRKALILFLLDYYMYTITIFYLFSCYFFSLYYKFEEMLKFVLACFQEERFTSLQLH